MPRGYRLAFCAAFGWLILAAQHPDPQASSEQANAQKAIANSFDDIAATYHQEAERSHRAKDDAENCGPSQYKTNADLCAQWKAADAARDSTWWAEVGLYVSGLSSILVLIAIGLAYQANSIARDTAKRQLRAYITFDSIVKVETEDGWKIQAQWKNTGQTPAMKAIGSLRWDHFASGIPSDFSYPPSRMEMPFGTQAIGPGQSIYTLTENRIRESDLQRVANGESRIIIWGWVEFSDCFGTGRRTESATELFAEYVGTDFGVHFLPIKDHNGMDGDCMKQPS